MHRHLPRRSSEGNSDITKPEVESRRAASRSESGSPARRDVIAEGPKANLWLLSNLCRPCYSVAAQVIRVL